jgi:methionyl-tRNA synthetase
MPKPFYATTPIYYINDVPHLGTAYTTIAADVITRYHRLRGEDAMFLTGTDEHGLKIERAAKEKGLSSQAFSDLMSAPFRDIWPKLDCDCGHFVRTTDPDHEKRLAEIWQKVEERGDIYAGSYEGWYCVGCELYYTEKELDPGGVCPMHKVPAERITEPTYFFRLSAYADRLLALYERNPSFVMPQARMNEVKSFVRGGLEDLSVSRTTFRWGVPVPGHAEHVMYVWFDALFSYYTPLLASPEMRRHWPATVHMVGKDILRQHAIYWPAFLMSAGLSDDELPQQVFAHGWLTLNGQKMSKALRNTVGPLTLADAFGVDPLRYYLMRAVAFGQDGDVNVKDLVARFNGELGNALGNLLNRVLPQCHRLTSGKVPAKGADGDLERVLKDEVSSAARAAALALDAIQPHRALEAIWGAIAAANQYVDKAAPWAAAKQGDQLRVGTILATALEALEAISIMVWPVIPRSAGMIREQIGLAPLAPTVGGDQWPFSSKSRREGDQLGVPAPIFPRIDSKREAEIIESLGIGVAPKEAASPPTIAVDAPKPTGTVAYDDFAKVDLRVGLVVSAERVPGKDKLLSLKVDLGEAESRPIVAGIALSYAPEDLVGKRVVVVANLDPRKFGKGLVSHGMLLAAGPSEALKLATVDDGVPPGTKVK